MNPSDPIAVGDDGRRASGEVEHRTPADVDVELDAELVEDGEHAVMPVPDATTSADAGVPDVSADPFRWLMSQRAPSGRQLDSATAEQAVGQALASLRTAAYRHRTLDDRYVRDATVQSVLVTLSAHCRQILAGTRQPPEGSWRAYLSAAMRRRAVTVRDGETRLGMRSVPDGELTPDPDTGEAARSPVIRLDAPVTEDGDTRIDRLVDDRLQAAAYRLPPEEIVIRAETDLEDRIDVLRRVGQLEAELVAGDPLPGGAPAPGAVGETVLCVFHPGRRCPHVRAGRISPTCRYRATVLEALRLVLLGELQEGEVRPWLARRTSLDPGRQGHEMERHVYRCLDWFGYLLVRRAEEPAGDLLQLAADGVTRHLEGEEAPSAVTVCLLLNHHPEIRVPEPLVRRYGPDHQPEGDLSS